MARWSAGGAALVVAMMSASALADYRITNFAGGTADPLILPFDGAAPFNVLPDTAQLQITIPPELIRFVQSARINVQRGDASSLAAQFAANDILTFTREYRPIAPPSYFGNHLALISDVPAAGGYLGLDPSSYMDIYNGSGPFTDTAVINYGGTNFATALKQYASGQGSFLNFYLISNTGQPTDIRYGDFVLKQDLTRVNQWAVDTDGDYTTASNYSQNTSPDAPNSTVTYGTVITAPRTVTVAAGGHAFGRFTFNSPNSYTLAAADSTSRLFATDPSGGVTGVTVTAGNHTIAVPIISFSNPSYNIAAGSTLTLKSVATNPFNLFGGSFFPPIDNVNGGGTLKVSSFLRTGRLDIETANGGYTSFVDLTTGFAVLQSGLALPGNPGVGEQEGTLRAQIGAWLSTRAAGQDPKGLGTTAIGSSGPTSFLTLGYILNTDDNGTTPFYSQFRGVGSTSDAFNALRATDFIVATTYIGDTNLDGVVNGVDLGNVLEGLYTPGASGWRQGDLNYDGVVDATDLGLLYASLNANLPSLNFGLTIGSPVTGAVPEPAALAIVPLAAMSLIRRRR